MEAIDLGSGDYSPSKKIDVINPVKGALGPYFFWASLKILRIRGETY